MVGSPSQCSHLLYAVLAVDGAGFHDPGIDAPQVEAAADLGVDEAQGIRAEPARELGAAGVGLVGDLDDRPADRQAGPWREVRAGQVQVDDQLVAGQGTSVGADEASSRELTRLNCMSE